MARSRSEPKNTSVEAAEPEGPGTEDELKVITWRAAKKGSVQAMKLMHEIQRADRPPLPEPFDPFKDLDAFDVDTLKVRE